MTTENEHRAGVEVSNQEGPLMLMKTPRLWKPMLLRVGLVGYIGFCLGAFWLGWRFSDSSYHARILSTRVYQMELGLQIYHHEQGAFPPTKYQPEPDGPVHSWRVVLAPLALGGPEGYDFSQEWNSPHNLQTFGEWPGQFFRSPGRIFSPELDSDIATILAIGEDDEWPSGKPLRAFMAEDGKDRFLLVDDPDSQVHWMEPKY